MALDVSALYFFMPVFSFLFVFLIVYALLKMTQVLGDMAFVNILVSFIVAVVFMNFSSADIYVQTIIPWFAVLLVCVFLVLLVAGLSTKDLAGIMTNKFAWVVVIILIIIFLIAAIQVFNPVFHPDKVIASAEGGEMGVVQQIRDIFSSNVGGTILLLVIVGVVAWIIAKK